MPSPSAVLSISAHWYLEGTNVTAMPEPRTIHDFRGFPRELYQIAYPADGDPDLARRIQGLLTPVPVNLDDSWGLDHGTWSILTHMLPKANIPVVQLSLNSSLPPGDHYEIGQRLSPLRDEGVLIMGSGNLVHNLKAYTWNSPASDPYEWAVRFENKVRRRLAAGDHQDLVDYHRLGECAELSVPTPDHYLPFLYIIALRKKDEPIHFPVEGFDGKSVSMLSVQIGDS